MKSKSQAVIWTQSFRHFLNYSSNQNTSFTKVALFGLLFQDAPKKVQLSLGHPAVILSLSELRIESKNFFYKSCSVWYAI